MSDLGLNTQVNQIVQTSLNAAKDGKTNEQLKAMAAKLDRSGYGLTEEQKAKQLDQAAQEFEAVFISQMLAPMFEGIKSDEMFGGGQAEETWKGMLVEEYGKILARSGGIGISDAVKAEMISLQEKMQ